jgi:hypothetical protein
MAAGDIRDIEGDDIVKDLIEAGYIEKVSSADKAKTEPKAEPKNQLRKEGLSKPQKGDL